MLLTTSTEQSNITTVPEKNRQKQLMLLTKRTEQSNITTVTDTNRHNRMK